MRRTALLASLLMAGRWSGAGPPLEIKAPQTVLPGERAFVQLVSIAPGEHRYVWNATGHAPLSYTGPEAAQTYSWATPGVKSVVVDVFHPCGAPVGWAQASIVVQGPPWRGQAFAWPQTYYWRVDDVDPTGEQQVHVVNQGPSAAWSFSADADWLSYAPGAGTGDASVTVSVDMTGRPPGRYQAVTELLSEGRISYLHTTVDVRPPGANQRPFGEFTAPPDHAIVSGSVPFTGWVLDDAGVEALSFFASPGNQLTPPALGTPPLATVPVVDGARPDVGGAYFDFPQSQRTGWGYTLLTNLLPGGGNGPYTLWALAIDRDGGRGWLGPRRIECANSNGVKPFGDIDEPGHGGTASGNAFWTTGWVLTPQPNMIPTDGSSIRVWIDGVSLGSPEYNQYRADVATLLPGYANGSGAGGRFSFDTTRYRNGVHTIMWTATDDAGNTDGIGSRYFTIQNNSTFAPPGTAHGGTARPTPAAAASEASPPPRVIAVSAPGRSVVTAELASYLPGSGGTFTGYTVHGDVLGPLPVGCTLDSESGAFAWQPGPAFAGTFVLEFWRTSAAGEIDSARLTLELGDAPAVTRKLHRPRRSLGAGAP